MNNQWHFYAGKKKEEFSCVCASLLSTDEERTRNDRQVKKTKKKEESQEAEQKDEKAHWSKHTIVLN